MSGRVFLGLLSRGNSGVLYGLNVRGQPYCRSYSTASNSVSSTVRKTERITNEKMKDLLPFEVFKEKCVKSLESFKESEAVKIICGNDVEKISEAYERFCLSQYSHYKHQAYGGNLALMV